MGTSLYNVDIESGVLACVLQYPDAWGDYYLIGESDFSDTNRVVFSIIKQQLDQSPPASVTPLVLAEKLKGFGVKIEGVEILDYLEGLRIKLVQKGDAAPMARELKRLTVRRELIKQVDQTRAQLINKANATFEEMTKMVEVGLTDISTQYYKPEVHDVLGDHIIEAVERRADNPIKPEEELYLGPFTSINTTIGPLIHKASLTILIARTGVGKSSFGFFWCVYVAERYGLPLLWLDAGEMTIEQLQMRAVCCLSQGKIPLWAVRSGEWRNNKEWCRLIREDIWPRVKKINMSYKNVGVMSPTDKIAFIRRFHYNKIGRDQFLIIGDDYLKGIESHSKNNQEYMSMGYHVGDIKNLVTDEINAGYWTSIQSNRFGITAGKKANEIQDSGEANAGISDRIVQQATTSLWMRQKVPEELSRENNMFGNMVLKKAKVREGYGRDYSKIAKPLKLSNGSFTDNFWHMSGDTFFYSDKGLHSDAMEILGDTQVNTSNGGHTVGPL